MAVTAFAYTNAPAKMTSKNIDWVGDTIQVLLLKSTYTPNQDTHVFVSDLTPGSNEVTGGGYSRQTLGGKSVVVDVATNHVRHFAGNFSIASSTITARYAVIFDGTPGSDATRPLIAYVDFGADVSSTNGTFLITWDATDGVFYAAAA